MEECLFVECLVERESYWAVGGGDWAEDAFGLVEGLVDDEGCRPPIVEIASVVEVERSSSGLEPSSSSSSNIVFRLAGGGLEDSGGSFLVTFKPYERVDMVLSMRKKCLDDPEAKCERAKV